MSLPLILAARKLIRAAFFKKRDVKTKYAVLSDKLLPYDVAELLLTEGTGPGYKSVRTVFKLEEYPGRAYLEKLLAQAAEAEISHPYTLKFIIEMLTKMIKNNDLTIGRIAVKIVQGDKTFLYAVFKE